LAALKKPQFDVAWVIKLGNVTTPQSHVYVPSADSRTDSAVVVCPGGGFSILAWDLEGTEVAEWLNSLGVTAVVLKYRVPTRSMDHRWLAPVQDAQRTMSIVRHRCEDWQLDPTKIGILGFSAGAATAGRTALPDERNYEAVDDMDQAPFAPNLAVLIYTAALWDAEKQPFSDGVQVTKAAPPMFLAHAFDDRVPVQNSVQLFLALKQADVPSELHVYDAGGHGYGLRPQSDFPVTSWPQRCEDWLRRNDWIE
jgi:acetyl esterase/lipase